MKMTDFLKLTDAEKAKTCKDIVLGIVNIEFYNPEENLQYNSSDCYENKKM